jgi:hypothetical protein
MHHPVGRRALENIASGCGERTNLPNGRDPVFPAEINVGRSKRSQKISDPNDPMVQIGKILNAHMNSLQWIENSTSIISIKLDEITKLHSALRSDNERSFCLTYYDN